MTWELGLYENFKVYIHMGLCWDGSLLKLSNGEF